MEDPKEDIFTALKIVFYINKIVGPAFFTLIGKPGCRKLVTKRRDILFLSVKLILGVYLCIIAWQSRLSTVSQYEVYHIPELSAMVFYFLLFLIRPIFEIFYPKKINKIYYKIEKVCRYFNKSGLPLDYVSVKKYSFRSFVSKILCSVWVIFEHFEYGNLYVTIFYSFTSVVTVCVETISTTLLYFIYKMSVKINFMVLKTQNLNDLGEAKDFLRVILNVHYDLYKICVDINKVNNVVILQFFICYSSVAFSAFEFATDMRSLSLMFIADFVLWIIFNLFVTTHVIYRCVRLKHEVRILCFN